MTDNVRGAARLKSRERPERGSARDAAPKTPPVWDAEKQAEIAGYIAQMTTELCQMAAAVELETLGYFLSMARLEAEMIARGTVRG